MAETMSFPKTLDEFMQQYKIVDTEKIYTNGAELIPIFRIEQWEDAHEPKKGKKFVEVVVDYQDPAICVYPNRYGKPYFSIRYEEGGEKYEGFGTYKPEVLSEYLREYFVGAEKETASNQDPNLVKVVRCKDCAFCENPRYRGNAKVDDNIKFCCQGMEPFLVRDDWFCASGTTLEEINE